ncbi:hypothetical protein F5Y01DRAFT_313613 [Xylaria sp. FL0043]|nr:hypothetical protein F5Y01DRAFT_313613 [Xylaria sp. FL0043]
MSFFGDLNGELRFKDKRSPRHARSSSSDTTSAFLPVYSQNSPYCKRPVLTRKVCRCVFWAFVPILGLFLLYLGIHQLFNEKTVQPLQLDFPYNAADPNTRPHEYQNTFATYKHFGEGCHISSLDLHHPYEPVCPDRLSMLTAMSSGGRIGRDAVYTPRGCDMRWYTTEEVCKILGQFSQVILVGDSMLRHVISALNIIIRENLGYGGVTDWNFDARERQCFCNDQFNVTDCSVQGIFKTEDVLKGDRSSVACPRLVPGWSTDLRMEQMVRYPIESSELRRLEIAIGKNPSSRKAFILGHGLWNNLEVDKSKAWLDTVIKTIDSKLKLRMRLKKTFQRGRSMPILLMTPNAAGEKKADEYLVTQGNKALIRFEHTMAEEAARQKIDHLGTWNMSIQANLYDGVHMDMKGNLLKAMMVVNWLNQLATEDSASKPRVRAPIWPE